MPCRSSKSASFGGSSTAETELYAMLEALLTPLAETMEKLDKLRSGLKRVKREGASEASEPDAR